jgi:hypothetical protein
VSDLRELPVAQLTTTGGQEECHLYCCDPDVAVCGVVLTGDEPGEGEPVDCFSCVAIDEADLPCRAAFCRVRSWRRVRWPS